jgi:microcystin-dependent protein
LSILKIPTAKAFEPLLQPARYKGVHGGRGSGKSHFFGELLVETCEARRGTLAVCIREAQRTLTQSSKRLIESKIASLGLGRGFKVFSDKIATPGDGLIIFRGMQDHTAESIKSLEGFKIAWVDEAQTLSARSLSLLRPTIREEGSELWASWNPYNVPLAGGLDYWGTTVPNSSFAFPVGQAISRATYAALFAIMGTTYGVGDGSTTFNLPDKTGRVSAMKEATGTRLTTAASGVDGGTMGSASGAQTQTLTLAHLPTGITVTGTITVVSNTNVEKNTNANDLVTVPTGGIPAAIAYGSPTSGTLTSTGANTLTSNNTSGNAHSIVQPTIICNYIIRII